MFNLQLGNQREYQRDAFSSEALGQLQTKVAPPRTLREQIQDQIRYHESKIVDLEAAVEALSPEVEKALNALGKL